MSSFKRIDGDYTIQSINSTDKIVIDSGRVEVTGNLEVSGNLTYINTEELEVKDPFILLNTSNTGSYNSNAGVLTHKTSSDFAGIRYNTNTSQWELSSSTSETGETGTWSAIATGASVTPGGANTNIQFNDGGSFGGNANFSFDTSTNSVELDGSIVLKDQGSVPSSSAGNTIIYANSAGSGGSGVYVVDGSTNEELVSKAKAIVFSIIF